MIKLFAVGYLILLLSCPAAGADQPDEAALLERLHDLQILHAADPEKAAQESRTMFRGMQRDKMPRAWIHAFTLIADREFGEALLPAFQDAQSFARARGLNSELAWLLAYEITFRRDGITKAEIQQKKEEAISLAKGQNNQLLLGQIRAAFAARSYTEGDFADALQEIKQAIALLKDVDERDQLFYYDARSILASILAEQGAKDRAIAMDRENLAWFAQHKVAFQAARMSYNLAITLMKMPGFAPAEVTSLLALSEQFAGQINHKERLADVYYGRGKFLLQQRDYAGTLKSMETAIRLYKEVGNNEFISLCLIYSARASLALRRWDEVEQALKAAKKLIPADFLFEQILLQELTADLHKARGEWMEAYAAYRLYFSLWQNQKEEQDKGELNKLSVSLGLQMEEERNRSLQRENEIQTQKLKEVETLRIFIVLLSSLGVGVLVMLYFTRRQTHKITSNHQKIRQILDHIDEGLLVLNEEQQIGPEYSRHLNVIFDRQDSLANQDFVAIAFQKDQEPVRDILQSMSGATRSVWEERRGQLPQEITIIHDRTVMIRWVGIFNKRELLTRFLVSLTDITHERQLESELSEQQKQRQKLPDVLQELLATDLGAATRQLRELQELLEQLRLSAEPQSFMKGLHTQKGIARTLGLRQISRFIHDLESLVQDPNTRLQRGALDGFITDLQKLLSEYGLISESLALDLSVPDNREVDLLDGLTSSLRAWFQQGTDAGIPWQELTVIDEVMIWQPGQVKLIQEFLLHAITNSLEHGFIFPHQRGEVLAKPCIEVHAQIMGEKLRISVRDNGVGLNLERMARIAQERGFVPQADEGWADVVFMEGVSTADKLTISSGRGVGLAAVKAAFEEKGGRVRMQANDRQRGTWIWGEFPWAKA